MPIGMEADGAQAASDVKMSEQLIAIYDQFGVPDPLRAWLLEGCADNVEKLAGCRLRPQTSCPLKLRLRSQN